MWRYAVLITYLAVLWSSWTSISTPIFYASLLILSSLIGSYYLWAVYATFKRDHVALIRFLKLKWHMRTLRKRDVGVPQIFEERVSIHPNKIAYYFEDESWTFKQLSDYSNRIANYFKENGVKKGDCVSVLMENRPEYVGLWLGLSKIGAGPALINTNLRHEPLKHCITLVNSSCIIIGTEFQKELTEIRHQLEDVKVFVRGGKINIPDAIDLDSEIENTSTTIPNEMHNVKFKDKMVYIYTSGTTGLPKAALITHSRAFFVSSGMFYLVGINRDEIVYDPLPLYHTSGGIMGGAMTLTEGVTFVVRKKFSASSYWTDCIKYKCTVGMYIGEICRYLLNTSPKPADTQHQVKMMFGNGLRRQVWEPFQKRFGIEKISEFYGATEGNANVVNVDGKLGAIGFLSIIIPSFYPVCLIKLDPDTEKPIRDKHGLCVRCKPGEFGEFVGRIIRNDPVRDFHGYTDAKATESKIVRDVWKKGDLAFLSGDILKMDELGYLYFKDRRGDTFRWRGENVSTTEVENVLTQAAGNADITVYGVEIPGVEGRAGMAAIKVDGVPLDLKVLSKKITESLPTFAQPLFIRIIKESDLTGTYKLKKVNLQKEGFDINKINDEIFFWDSKNAEFLPLTADLYEKILDGKARL